MNEPVTVQLSGPIFEAAIETLMRNNLLTMERETGDEAQRVIGSRLQNVLVNPTGKYQSSITQDVVQDDVVVSDGGVVYGPWLEGMSSRNNSTRFKGYATFRNATQEVERRVPQVIQSAVAKLIGDLT